MVHRHAQIIEFCEASSLNGESSSRHERVRGRTVIVAGGLLVTASRQR
jgi:hypothetical protein